MSGPLPVCPLWLLSLRALPGISQEICWQDTKVAFQSLLFISASRGKKRFVGSLQTAGPPQFTARKTRIRMPGYYDQGKDRKMWAQRAKFSIVFPIRSSVVTIGHIEHVRAQHLSSNWICMTKALHLIVFPCAISDLDKITHSYSLHPLSSSSDLLLQKCWVQWKLLCTTLKNRDTGSKFIKHLLNQDQINQALWRLFLYLHENQVKAT